MKEDKGEVKWNKKEYLGLIKWIGELVQTPKDDWDLKKSRVKLEDGRVIESNPFSVVAQVFNHMDKEYGDNASYYYARFYNINKFTMDYEDELEKKDLIMKHDKGVKIRDILLEVLCKMPYTKKVNKEYTFDYDEVMKEIKYD
jgi:hypothetical protein